MHRKTTDTFRVVLAFVSAVGIVAPASFAQTEQSDAGTHPGEVTTGPADSGWPRTYAKEGDQVVLYQPQVDEWPGYTKIRFRAALAITPAGQKEPSYGVLAVKADTSVDHDTRTVRMTSLDIDVRFIDLPQAEAAKLERMTRDLLPQQKSLLVSLDRVLACMDARQVDEPRVHVNLDPPPIYRSESPAIMVIFAGAPQLKPVKGTRLMCAINTNWDVLLDLGTSRYYLLDGDAWLAAPDPLKGPWTAAGELPEDFGKLPADANWEDVRTHIPGVRPKAVPQVFTSTVPAELIVTEGAPAYTPLSGVDLMYVSNPEMPLFLDPSDMAYYYLVAGRWFRAKSLDGPWSAASSDLPAKFAHIPAGSPVGYVLASVPGTREARDAILLASVPHTATINRAEAKLDVTYDGKPKFEKIKGTSLRYAVNTPYDVIRADKRYYCCYQGVWFVASKAEGPWAVCADVPQVIYTIPPSCPLYNVTYVHVYSSTDTAVVCGYTSGYSGAYVAATGTLMFGAGMLVGAAIASDSWYHCSPAYISYGCAATYHYGYGGYYCGAAYHGPYGGAGHYAGYNAATGTFSRGAYRYGPAGAAGVHAAYNPFTNTYRAHAGATNGYQSWGRSVAQRGNAWAAGGHVSGEAGRAGWVQTSGGRSAWGAQGAGGGAVVKGPGDNIYAGKDGHVYRKPEGGDWQHYQNGGWRSAAERGAGGWDAQRMNSEFQSRFHGNELDSRVREFRSGRFGGGRFGGFRRR